MTTHTANLFDTATLVGIVPNLMTSQNWLLDKFFPNIVTSETEFVSIDVDVGQRRMAPFVSPLVAGKQVESRRMQTNTFKPAYIKDKRVPDLRKPIRRQIGERIGGEYTAAQREQLNMMFEMADQVDILNRRLEWMGASALTTGKVVIEGEGFEKTEVDFGRASDLTVALSGSDLWSNTTTSSIKYNKPTAHLNEWVKTVLKKSGAVVRDIVFTSAAWDAFVLDATLEGAIIFPAMGPYGNVINPGTQVERGAVYKGRWGQLDLWLYNDWYVDDNGVEQPMLPDGTVVLSGPDLQGTRAFGAIMDPAFNYGPMAYAPKTWVQEDPAQRFLLMQSSPIVIPSRVNAALCATVV
ncbi:major capsid protein [Nissabacter sp. SGAir0207]|uniref:major capsid protein n=1 Tax=Nissabacter sp. SGAir0207 TaxID=2126321 RepID=UPI0010CD173A|nr:major capsid protein [Nissabacter sp. SGAir0207]QCR38951.1 capsid protein [Nissabacter sp. SGAir0207]